MKSGIVFPVRPAIVEDEHLNLLDALRRGGTSGRIKLEQGLYQTFELRMREVHEVLDYWRLTYPRYPAQAAAGRR